MGRGAYQRYSDSVRHEIARTGNVKLFPSSKIPRSTAYQWVKNREAIINKSKNAANQSDQSLVSVVRAFFECIASSIDLDQISDTQLSSLTVIVNDPIFIKSGVLPTAFLKRLQKKSKRCSESVSGAYLRRHPDQLSADEVRVMREMIQSPKYAHMPICSVAMLARRRGILSCGVQTWYKYVARNKWTRPHRRQMRTNKKFSGLHAKYPHEYWHMDVTKVRLFDGTIQCLQVVLDNRSRAVLSWHISSTVRGNDSARLIDRAQLKARVHSRNLRPVHLIVDGGPENIGDDTLRLQAVETPRVLRRIARREIRHANTMIEVFFKSLKSNYLKHQEIRSVDDLRQAVSYYVYQHNAVVPRMALNGLTPNEVLAGVGEDEFLEQQRIGADAAREGRRRYNAARQCRGCRA
jgi:putative transposase